jgi:hypothetical protein
MKKLFIVTFLILSGCTGLDEFLTPVKKADQHYLECRATNYDFVEVVKCGRAARYQECLPSKCSLEGNRFVIFADNLANDVANNVLSQEEAYRYLYQGIQAFNADLQSRNAASSAALINLGAAISGGRTIGSSSSIPSRTSAPPVSQPRYSKTLTVDSNKNCPILVDALVKQEVFGLNRICYYR